MTSSQAQGSEPTESVDVPAAPASPRIEVLGDATPEQVAALVAVLSGLGGGEDEAPAGSPSRWSAPARLVRHEVHPSPGGWVASGLPR
ncbi:acyl-CoA carboxylase subunit epsilon [Janibacter limosus]|uniref:acyl-CoA carboxylase subunit epsilon n=1 Tax=Janibacter limosus TaxID=53458 RepID=UPI0035D938F1|nr:acyl-CoA carboxylase subunit epsilon [Janibacter limosus]